MYAWDEAIGHAEAAVAILDHVGAPPARQAEAAARAAELLIRATSDYGRAVEHLQAALEHYRATSDDVAIATVRSRLGYVLSVHYRVMDIPRALEHFAAAESLLTDGSAAFDVHHGQAMAAVFGLRTEEGCAASDRARELADGLGRPDLVALAQAWQASHRAHRGELTAALGNAPWPSPSRGPTSLPS